MQYKQLPETICEALLIELFQSVPQLLQTVASDGFANSQLVLVFHPTPEQQYKEYKQIHENINRLHSARKNQPGNKPLQSFDEFIKDIKIEPVNERYEAVHILGDCIWKIFSNNHTVFNENNESYDLGSWRGTGGFIADVINKLQLVANTSFDYLDFYMGGMFRDDRADLTPVYEFIFKKLKAKHLDWEYSFPRMGLISFHNNDNEKDDIENYNPEEALKKQMEREQQQNEIDKLQQQFDDIHNSEYEEARYKKPSQEVMAYYKIYSHYPKGHPLADE